jgi:hypothetical protein
VELIEGAEVRGDRERRETFEPEQRQGSREPRHL